MDLWFEVCEAIICHSFEILVLDQTVRNLLFKVLIESFIVDFTFNEGLRRWNSSLFEFFKINLPKELMSFDFFSPRSKSQSILWFYFE
jgi:hypothetical protein